jgi:hypothetical protein
MSSSMTSTTDPQNDPSPETAFLGEMRQKAWRWMARGLAVGVVAVVVLAGHLLGKVGVVVGGVGAGYGLILIWLGVEWLRLLPYAHNALKMPPVDVRLEVKRNLGMWKRSTNAQLWPKDSVTPPSLAQFSETMHWAKPRLMSVDKVPAKVFGTPTTGAIVVVSCADGVVAGRIKRSHLS